MYVWEGAVFPNGLGDSPDFGVVYGEALSG